LKLKLSEGRITPRHIDPSCLEVFIQGSGLRMLANGSRMVTIFLVNAQLRPKIKKSYTASTVQDINKRGNNFAMLTTQLLLCPPGLAGRPFAKLNIAKKRLFPLLHKIKSLTYYPTSLLLPNILPIWIGETTKCHYI